MNMPLTITRMGLVIFVAMILPARTAAGADMKSLVEGNTAFALQLYGKLQSQDGNLAFSPYSISSALAMTCAGARGETARQMEQVLYFDQSQVDLAPLVGQLNKAVKAAKGDNELNIANSIWPQKKYPFREDFLTLLKQDYGATVTPLDYAHNAEHARVTINQWVDSHTRHKINEIIGPGVLDSLTRMVLVNAIYFKGTWLTPFPEDATQSDRFYPKPEKHIRIPFMHVSDTFRYGENDRLQLISLPYIGDKLEMLILLPRDRDGLGQLENDLNTTNLSWWMSTMRVEQVDVALPKFKITSEFGLAETLRAMGMEDAFDATKADFSGMDGQLHWLCISAVLHKAYVDVYEKGTEAAAATGMVMAGAAEPIVEHPKQFLADHPFVFMIRDSTTGSILFLGRVAQPGD
jgi:serine protease inhibitor